MKMKLLSALCLSALVAFAACKKDEEDSTPTDPNGGNGGGGQQTSLTVLPSQTSQSVTGNLSSGQPLTTLDWAWTSNMACFVETAEDRYTGNHVFYQIELPTQSIATVQLIPDDPTAQIALYGFTKASGSMALPPDVSSCVACEADPSNSNGSLTGERDIEFVAITNPYSIIIGVAGGDELASGGYTLHVDIDS